MGYNYVRAGPYGTSPVQTVPARPIQISAHHHIDVCTDINKGIILRIGDSLTDGKQLRGNNNVIITRYSTSYFSIDVLF